MKRSGFLKLFFTLVFVVTAVTIFGENDKVGLFGKHAVKLTLEVVHYRVFAVFSVIFSVIGIMLE